MLLQTHSLSCDILVAGGGPAGVPCALAAARNGSQVILCQDLSGLGGNASSEVRMHIVGANGTGSFDRGAELETEAREGGIIEEIRLENSTRNPQRSAAVFDLILYDMCRCEPNLTLMLNTTVTGAEIEGNRIKYAIAERQSTEDKFQIQAEIFIDCTGDGRLGAEAGAAFMEGREDRQAFGESLAVEVADQHRLGSTILLQAKNHHKPMPYQAPKWARKFSKQDLKQRLYSVPGEEEPTHEYGYWWAEWGGTLDTIRENETIRDELMAIALGIWDHVKNGPPESKGNDDPFEAACWALEWIGFLPGKRESRRFLGQHVLTQSEIISSQPFADAIAYGGWSLDLHPPEGVDAPEKTPCTQTRVPHLYDIPLRCCVARDLENLMFAGRNISATHVGFSSTRVMATCAVVGQGVGTAAAYAQQNKISISNLVHNSEAIIEIQQRLLRDDAFLIGHVNSSESDLARSATITASSEQTQGEASNVISGQTRSVHGPDGATPARANPGTHRWMSVPGEELPAWLQFDWTKPVSISGVQLIFDTGLHRHLTLSHHDGYTSKMIWGQPQPETVADYKIEVKQSDSWVTLVNVTGNTQRLRRHTFEGTIQIDSLRIVINATHGLDHARIMEVRVDP